MKTIMVVGDDAKINLALKKALGEGNYVILTASTQEECLAKINATHVNLLLIEVLFPRTKILGGAGNIEIIYLITKNTPGTDWDTFENVMAFSGDKKGNKRFLSEIKERLGE